MIASGQALALFLENSGNPDLSIDGSLAIAEGKQTVPDDEQYLIEEIDITLSDSGNFTADKIGAATALTNGIRLYVANDEENVVFDITGGLALKNNLNIESVFQDAELRAWGTGDEVLSAALKFPEPILVESGHDITCVIEDDLTVLTGLYIFIRGARLANRAASVAPELASLTEATGITPPI